MRKLTTKTLNQKHKTFPANVSVFTRKQTDGLENITLLVNRRNSSTTNQKSTFTGLRYKISKKLLLILIIICMCLIIYANSEQFFRQRIFAVFLSSSREDYKDNQQQENSSDKVNSPINHEHDRSTSLTAEKNLRSSHYLMNSTYLVDLKDQAKDSKYNIFVIYTKENNHLHMKFDLFAHSLLKHSSAALHLHIITDAISETSAVEILQKHIRRFHRTIIYTLYDIVICSKGIKDITSSLTPYFTSTPTSYYSDSLFFLSLGLHRIADSTLERAVLLDCDIVFRSDVRLLFNEFDRFLPHQLFGLAPELTPVYRHILYRYRVKFPKTNFGNSYYPLAYVKKDGEKSYDQASRVRIRHGYPGLNSGVVLIYLNRVRSSKKYSELLTQPEVNRLVTKYSFKGHLGDQDFFTLLGYEYPNLIYRLDCVWNRQLCTWWKDHGYSDIFDAYFHCEGTIRMYHGNCNTRVPE